MGTFNMFNFSLSKFWAALQDQYSDLGHSDESAASGFGENDQPYLCDADWQAAAGSILEDIATASTANVPPAALIQTNPQKSDETAGEAVNLASVYQTSRMAFDPGSFAAGRSVFQVKPLVQRRHAVRGLWISPNVQDDK